LEILSSQNFVLVKKRPFDPKVRGNGEDWPMFGYSMIGHRRLENIEYCIRSALSSGVEGDFVECGVWRGGASIYARSVLNLLGAQDRTVWLADSFEGFPVQKQEDKLDPPLAGVSQMIVQLDEVKENFARFGLLGDNVKFLKGWFSDTLAGAPIKKIAVLRLDGDYYSSTMDSLNGLYDRVSPMGYIIVDDFNCFKSCEQAVEDFCSGRGIKPNFIQIEGGEGVYWQKLEH
jgi:O-methyltransferase